MSRTLVILSLCLLILPSCAQSTRREDHETPVLAHDSADELSEAQTPSSGVPFGYLVASTLGWSGASAPQDDPQDFLDREFMDDFEGRTGNNSSSRRESGLRMRKGQRDISAGLQLYAYPDSDAELGGFDGAWDSGNRYEITVSGHYQLTGHAEPVGTAYFFFEHRDWESGAASVESDTYGLGAEFGVYLYPLPRADDRWFNVSLFPFLRGGIGYVDGDFDNVAFGNGFTSGDIGDARVEASAGAEIRAIVARTVTLGLGAGWGWWEALDVSGVVRNGVGVIILRDADIGFRGTDTFVRFSVTIAF